MKPSLLSRRRFICISAAVGGIAMLPSLGRAALTHNATRRLQDHTWEGIALGADASLRISHYDPSVAQQLLNRCVAEVHRLEKLFSLYRDDSTLSLLNRQGIVHEPSSDFLALLSESINFAELTNGVFDITVQPLWAAYARHFSSPTPPLNGPDQNCIQDALNLVDYRKLKLSTDHVTFTQAGMAITLNGIAQGYITDRITQLLASQGVTHALVNMGEIRGINNDEHRAPWRVGLENPLNPGTITGSINLVNQAVATSSGYGTPLAAGSGYNHLLDPRSGASSHRYQSVSVVASNATTADALSTAFSFMPESDIQDISSQLQVKAYLTRNDGSHIHIV